MKVNILIDFKRTTSKDKVEISKDIIWYDSLRKKMRKYRGGKMVMRYRLENEEEKEINSEPILRWLPVIEDDFEVNKKVDLDKNSIKKWHETYIRYNDSESEIDSISDNGVIVSVPKEEIKDLFYDLERNGFYYQKV